MKWIWTLSSPLLRGGVDNAQTYAAETPATDVWNDFDAFSVNAVGKSSLSLELFNGGDEEDEDDDDWSFGGVIRTGWDVIGDELIAYFQQNGSSGGSGGGGGTPGGSGPGGGAPLPPGPELPDLPPLDDDPSGDECLEVMPPEIDTDRIEEDNNPLADRANELLQNFIRQAILHGDGITAVASNGSVISLSNLFDFAASNQTVNFGTADHSNGAPGRTTSISLPGIISGHYTVNFDLNAINSGGNFDQNFLVTLVHELMHVDTGHSDYGLDENEIDDIAKEIVNKFNETLEGDLTDPEDNCDGGG